jgi:aspartate-semialdehyde dehydrogenase
MAALNAEIQQAISHEPVTVNPSIFARQIAFNCIPHIDRFERGGYTREEIKMLNETRKIFGQPNLLINATTVRVPVLIGHCESINAEFAEPMRADKAIEILSDPTLSPGVVCFGEAEHYPIPSDLENDAWKDAVLVGRIRDDMTACNAINLWCVSDNLRKGAATNAVQIAQGMLANGLL